MRVTRRFVTAALLAAVSMLGTVTPASANAVGTGELTGQLSVSPADPLATSKSFSGTLTGVANIVVVDGPVAYNGPIVATVVGSVTGPVALATGPLTVEVTGEVSGVAKISATCTTDAAGMAGFTLTSVTAWFTAELHCTITVTALGITRTVDVCLRVTGTALAEVTGSTLRVMATVTPTICGH